MSDSFADLSCGLLIYTECNANIHTMSVYVGILVKSCKYYNIDLMCGHCRILGS